MLSPREQNKAKYKTTTMLLLDNTHLRGGRRDMLEQLNISGLSKIEVAIKRLQLFEPEGGVLPCLLRWKRLCGN